MKSGSELAPMIDDREGCMSECFKAVKGNTESIYCIERCNETFNARLKKVVAGVAQSLDGVLTAIK